MTRKSKGRVNRQVFEPVFRRGFMAGQNVLFAALKRPEGVTMDDGGIARIVITPPPAKEEPSTS